MYKITKNEFIKNGRVHYKDEGGNILFIQGSPTGKEFKAKVRFLNPRLHLKPIYFSFPFELEGIDFKLEKEMNLALEERDDFIGVLKETTDILERWVVIERNLYALASDDMRTLSKLLASKDKDAKPEHMEYMLGNFALDELSGYEEMKPYMALYTKEQ